MVWTRPNEALVLVRLTSYYWQLSNPRWSDPCQLAAVLSPTFGRRNWNSSSWLGLHLAWNPSKMNPYHINGEASCHHNRPHGGDLWVCSCATIVLTCLPATLPWAQHAVVLLLSHMWLRLHESSKICPHNILISKYFMERCTYYTLKVVYLVILASICDHCI